MNLLLSTLALFLLGACASSGDRTAMPPASNSMQEGHLPTPFSASDIRDSCTEGSFRVFSMETPEGIFTQTLLFGEGDSEGAPFAVVMTDSEGVEIVKQDMPHTAWTEFQSHASCETETTILTREMMTTGAGEFDCWVYRSDGPMGMAVTNYFAVDLPGPPVLSLGVGADGTQLVRTELTDYNR
ncbi:MAG: hypothetical protein ACI8Q9_000559 [Planctomycetota bacterium]|jgi:hypothetical protein